LCKLSELNLWLESLSDVVAAVVIVILRANLFLLVDVLLTGHAAPWRP